MKHLAKNIENLQAIIQGLENFRKKYAIDSDISQESGDWRGWKQNYDNICTVSIATQIG